MDEVENHAGHADENEHVPQVVGRVVVEFAMRSSAVRVMLGEERWGCRRNPASRRRRKAIVAIPEMVRREFLAIGCSLWFSVRIRA